MAKKAKVTAAQAFPTLAMLTGTVAVPPVLAPVVAAPVVAAPVVADIIPQLGNSTAAIDVIKARAAELGNAIRAAGVGYETALLDFAIYVRDSRDVYGATPEKIAELYLLAYPAHGKMTAKAKASDIATFWLPHVIESKPDYAAIIATANDMGTGERNSRTPYQCCLAFNRWLSKKGAPVKADKESITVDVIKAATKKEESATPAAPAADTATPEDKAKKLLAAIGQSAVQLVAATKALRDAGAPLSADEQALIQRILAMFPAL